MKQKALQLSLNIISLKSLLTFLSFFYPPDSSMYAHFLFEAFDTRNNGSVTFEVIIFFPLYLLTFTLCISFPHAPLWQLSTFKIQRHKYIYIH